MITLRVHARLGNFRLGGEPPRPPSRLLLEYVIHLSNQSNYNFEIHMEKSKLVSVRVPESILDKIDKLLKHERFINRSGVICALLDVAASTLNHWQLESLTHVSSRWNNPVVELHIKYRVYGKIKEIHFVDESQKNADD